jgi:exodeoxyribonuclease-3
MTWNIRNGGGDRLDGVAAVVSRERPDVLALQELRGFDADGGRRMRTFAETAGMVPHLARSVFGQPVAVLVRPPLVGSGRVAVSWRLHHAAAAVTVATAVGPVTVVSTHLNPYRPRRRRREATWLAGRFAGHGRVLLAGDLNTLDPGTDHTATIEALAPAYRGRHVDPDGTVNTSAISAFARGGLVDVWPLVGSGDGRTAPTTGGGGREFSGMRLDYVLAGRALVAFARDAHVVRGGETESASDHYPLVVDLDIAVPPAPGGR